MSGYPQRPPKPSSYSPTFLARQASYASSYSGHYQSYQDEVDAFALGEAVTTPSYGGYTDAGNQFQEVEPPLLTDAYSHAQVQSGTGRPLPPPPPPMLRMPDAPVDYRPISNDDEVPSFQRRPSNAGSDRRRSGGFHLPRRSVDETDDALSWQQQQAARQVYENLYQQPLEQPYPVDFYDAYEAQVDAHGSLVNGTTYTDNAGPDHGLAYTTYDVDSSYAPYSSQSTRPLPTPLSRPVEQNDSSYHGAYSFNSDDSVTAWDPASAVFHQQAHANLYRHSSTSVASNRHKHLPPIPNASQLLARSRSQSPTKPPSMPRSESLPTFSGAPQSGLTRSQSSLDAFLEESAETLRGLPGRPTPSSRPLPAVRESNGIGQAVRHGATYPRSHAAENRRASAVTLDELSARLGRRPSKYTQPVAPVEAPPLKKEIVRQVFSAADYESCTQVWSRSGVFFWLYTILQEPTAEVIIEALVGLFTHHVQTFSSIHAERAARSLLASFFSAGELVQIEQDADTLRFALDVGDGVLPLLTGGGCYAPRCQVDLPNAPRCYACRCSRTLPVRLDKVDATNPEDWAAFWGLSMETEPLKSLSKDEIQRQYQIHEVVYSERDYLESLQVLDQVFKESFVAGQVGQPEVAELLFGLVPRLIVLSAQHLEPALRACQAEQGPCIQHIGHLFLPWLDLARDTYLAYAANLRHADRAIRMRKARDPAVQRWLARCAQDPRTKKLDLFSFMGAPTRRLQRYALLLADVLKKTPTDHSEHALLSQAIAAIQEVCQACNSSVERAENKIMLLDLSEQLVWRVPKRELGLLEEGRVILRREHLQRKSDSHLEWQMREIVLLDHYMLCLKSVRDGPQRVLSRPPIPIDYLLAEDSDEVIYKASTSKLLGGTMTHSVASPLDDRGRRSTIESTLTMVDSIKSPSELSITPTLTSTGTPATPRDGSKMLFPFTVKHAGRWEKQDGDEKWTLYAESRQARQAWVDAIRQAKQRRFEKYKHAEPFVAHLCATDAFGSYGTEGLGLAGGVATSGVQDQRLNPAWLRPPENTVEWALQQAAAEPPRSAQPLTWARVQCATMFRNAEDDEVLMLGTDDGLYHAVISHEGSPVWRKVAAFPRVTQVAVLQQFGCAMVLADKSLTAYHLDDLLYAQASQKRTRAPQKLSGSNNVGFFEVGVMKDRLLVVFKKKDNGNSVFKALEPVVGRKQDTRSIFKKSSSSGTDFFRDFDQFFIPTDCYGMQYLRSTICVHCSRGFEILSLDSKQPMTIPDLTSPVMASLKARIDGARPLGTYRLAQGPPDAQGHTVEGEFLCCYTACALFVDKYGQLSRAYTLEWEGRPQHAVLLGSYIVAAGPNFVEVWHVEKRRLRQVITGKDVRILPCSSAGGGLVGSSGPGGASVEAASRGVLIAMAHPFKQGRQIVMELRLRS